VVRAGAYFFLLELLLLLALVRPALDFELVLAALRFVPLDLVGMTLSLFQGR
jgi:hypothetical protein